MSGNPCRPGSDSLYESGQDPQCLLSSVSQNRLGKYGNNHDYCQPTKYLTNPFKPLIRILREFFSKTCLAGAKEPFAQFLSAHYKLSAGQFQV